MREKEKLLAAVSAFALIALAVRVSGAKAGTVEAAVAKIELFLGLIAVIGVWLLYLTHRGYKAKTGDDFIKNRVLGRAQSESILQAYDKASRDQQYTIDAQRNRTRLPHVSSPYGVVFGKSDNQWVFSPAVGADAPHTFVYGPTGSGKTQCIVLPTIAAWPKSARILAIDVSGDITQAVKDNSWMRGGAPAVLDFTSWDAPTRFDVFHEIRKRADRERARGAASDYIKAIEVSEIEKLALCLVPEPRATDNSNQYFIDGGRDLLCAAMLCGFFSGLGFIASLRLVTETPLDTLLQSVKTCGIKAAAAKVTQFEGQNEKNVSGVRGEAVKGAERITKNAIAARVLTPPKIGDAARLLTPADIEKSDIFIRLRMTDIDILSSVIGMIITQMMDYFYTRDLSFAADHPILVAADELPSYCRYWSGLDNDIRNLRKFGVRLLMCSQDFTSLDAEIGEYKRKTIVANCGYKVVLGSYIAADQKELSALVGDEEQLKRVQSYAPHSQSTYTDRWEYMPAIRPEDFGTLAAAHQLVVLAPTGWERLKTAPFWQYKDELRRGATSLFN